MSLNPLKPYLYGAVALVAVSGWAFGGWQTIRYVSEQRDHEATKAGVGVDANKAAEEAIAALQAAHAQEMQDLQDLLEQQRLASAAARTENLRLMFRLKEFEKTLGGITDEKARTYLSQPVPDAVRNSLRDAQRRQ